MIDFETDKANVITKTENIRSLADQVENLEQAKDRIFSVLVMTFAWSVSKSIIYFSFLVL